MTARLHRGGVANRADRIERVALDRSLIHMRAGHPGKALNLLAIASRVIEGLRVDLVTAVDELRAAAEELRGLSGMASRGRWRVEANRPTDVGQSYAVRPDYPGTRESAWFKVADGCTIMDANLIATMNPTVALALADWLTSVAEVPERELMDGANYRCAVNVALAINGGAS